MTYRNRIKKLKSKKGEGWWRLPDEEWKLPYLKTYYREDADPVSSKSIGWKEFPYKSRHIQKRIRRGGKQIIQQALLEMETEITCPYCGSPFCENQKSCKDEYDLMVEMEIYHSELYFHEDEIRDDYDSYSDDYNDIDVEEEEYLYDYCWGEEDYLLSIDPN